MTTPNMQDLGKTLQQIQAQQVQMQSAIALLASRLDRSHLYMKPGAVATPEEQYQQTVLNNVELMREGIAARSWEMIESLTSEWSQDYKGIIAGHLTTQEKQIIKKLKELFNLYMKPALAALNEATEKHLAAIEGEGIEYQLPTNKPDLKLVPVPAIIAYQQLNNGYQMPVASTETPIAETPKPSQLTAPTPTKSTVTQSPILNTQSPIPDTQTKTTTSNYSGWGTPSIAIGIEAIDTLNNIDTDDNNEKRTDEEIAAYNSIMPQ